MWISYSPFEISDKKAFAKELPKVFDVTLTHPSPRRLLYFVGVVAVDLQVLPFSGFASSCELLFAVLRVGLVVQVWEAMEECFLLPTGPLILWIGPMICALKQRFFSSSFLLLLLLPLLFHPASEPKLILLSSAGIASTALSGSTFF